MSDTDSSSSTDSDNNNGSPFFNHYLDYSQEYNYELDDVESPGLETDNSSSSEIIHNLNHLDSSSSDVKFLSPYLIYFIFIFVLSF